MIDNISRLNDVEIKTVFQFMTSLADFNHTIYLITLNKEHTFSTMQNMIPLSFEIPPFAPEDLEALLANRLQPTLNLVPNQQWNSSYWADLYTSSLKYFFT